MNKRRLLRLAKLLDEHRDNGTRFDLGVWREEDFDDDGWCGTKACAIGLACVDPQFMRAGLKYVVDVVGGGGPVFKEFVHWHAVHKFFGLKLSQAEYLFSFVSYRGAVTGNGAAKNVACRIRKVVAEGFPKRLAA